MRFDEIDLDVVICFRCNLCGTANEAVARTFHREISNCSKCGSTPRNRGIIKALSEGLFGETIDLPDFPIRKDIRGIGMSDWDGYAKPLADKLDFANTFFHQEPRLDILSGDWKKYSSLDFIICSEVFEHITQPVILGFSNLRSMLKPNGLLIFTTPFFDMPHTNEHFPGISNFVVAAIGDQWIVVNRNADLSYTVFDKNICFHGGPGTVLEMRQFARTEIERLLDDAGFEAKLLSEPDLERGYYWPIYVTQGAGPTESYIVSARPAKLA